MSMAIVTLKKGEGRTLKAGGAWIYDNEIESIMGNAENGEIVLVHDFDGYPLGRGFINRNSKIRVRMMTRHIDQEIDREFLKMRVKDAWDYRKTTVDTSSCRVIFGEADFLPGLVVDKYEDVLVVECLALGMEAFKETIVELLKEVLAEDGIVVRGVYERSDANERKKEGLPKVKDFIGAPFDTDVEITENGVHYQVDVVNGQKTGFFLDQKYNRLAIQRLCRGKRVLDCFTHMGTFALNAGIAGAFDVTGLDISEYAIQQAEENARRNHLEGTVHFRCANVFDELPRLAEQKEQYRCCHSGSAGVHKVPGGDKKCDQGVPRDQHQGTEACQGWWLSGNLFLFTFHDTGASGKDRARGGTFRTQASPSGRIPYSVPGSPDSVGSG